MMTITSRNFNHIEPVEDGIKVLFHVGLDFIFIKVHHDAPSNRNTVEMSLRMPIKEWDELFPDKMVFQEGAKLVVKALRELGLHFNRGPMR